MSGTLDGRVVIVTGAGRGIGASVSRLFAEQGAKLVVNDLGAGPDGTGGDEGPARDIADEIVKAGGEAVSDGGDIADTATGKRLVDLAVDTYGKLDVVVNVAGILRDKMIFNLDDEDWDAVIRVHLRGHFSTVKPAAAYWRGQRNPDGHFRIINFTSDSALQGSPGQPNYAAAKMGIIGLTASLANALGRYGVTANAIAPGAATRLTATIPQDKQLGSSERPADDDSRSPDNIAPLVTYLASEASDWISGRTLGAAGYGVTLWNNPEVRASIASDGPWDLDDLAREDGAGVPAAGRRAAPVDLHAPGPEVERRTTMRIGYGLRGAPGGDRRRGGAGQGPGVRRALHLGGRERPVPAAGRRGRVLGGDAAGDPHRRGVRPQPHGHGERGALPPPALRRAARSSGWARRSSRTSRGGSTCRGAASRRRRCATTWAPCTPSGRTGTPGSSSPSAASTTTTP